MSDEPQIVRFARSIAEYGYPHSGVIEQYEAEHLATYSERLAGEVWATIDGVLVIRSDGVKVYIARTKGCPG
jgi:beta-lactamase superfamily II metal-dependent hydrolase